MGRRNTLDRQQLQERDRRQHIVVARNMVGYAYVDTKLAAHADATFGFDRAVHVRVR